MELKTWLKAERGRTALLSEFLTIEARKVDPERTITSSFVSQMGPGKGGRPIPANLAHAIEQFTKGEVMRWDCCPRDWHQLWPELRVHRDAPPIPQAQPPAAATAQAAAIAEG